MKKRLSVVLVAAVALAGLVGTSSAAAATEFGSACTANGTFDGGRISLAHGTTSPLPAVAPSSGVITEWKVNVGSLPTYVPAGAVLVQPTLDEQLYVVRSSDLSHYTVVGKSETARASLNAPSSFLTRIPVQQGDLLALVGANALSCRTEDLGDKVLYFPGTPGVGGVIETKAEPFSGSQLPVVAKIEPDVDGDGYGDETQDKCPQSAAYQGACPVVKLGVVPTVKSKAVILHVSASLSAKVTVAATVPLGKGKKVRLSAPGQTIKPGTLPSFRLALPPSVTKALDALSTKKALRMKITARAPNLTGRPSKATATVALKGLAKPKPKHHKAPKKSKKK
jgi:hypothetical protein